MLGLGRLVTFFCCLSQSAVIVGVSDVPARQLADCVCLVWQVLVTALSSEVAALLLLLLLCMLLVPSDISSALCEQLLGLQSATASSSPGWRPRLLCMLLVPSAISSAVKRVATWLSSGSSLQLGGLPRHL